MKKPNSSAVRVGVAGVALLAVGGVGAAVAFEGGLPKPATNYSMSRATTGSITQTWYTTGAISRTNQAVISFGSTGTVTAVKVQLGDAVHAGDVLATIDPTQLKLSQVVAQAMVTQAQAQLEIDQAAADAAASASTTSSTGSTSGASGSASATVTQLAELTAQLKTLSAQLAAADAAAAQDKAASQAATAAKEQLLMAFVTALASPDCTATFARGLAPAHTTAVTASPTDSPSPSTTPSTASPSPTPTPSATPSDSPSPTPTASVSVTPSPSDSASPSPSATPSDSASPSPSPSTTPTATPDLPGVDQVAGCRALLADAIAAANLPSGGSTPGPNGPGGQPTPSPTTGAPSTGSGTKTSAPSGSATGAAASGSTARGATASGAGGGAQSGPAKVASDEVSLLQAQQNLATAQQNLAAATITAPIDGRVGTNTYVAGSSSAGKSMTIIGDGAATVTVNVPLSVRPLITNSEAATVSVPGSTESLTGVVTQVNILANSGTANGNPLFATQITVPDPQSLLHAGGVASVSVSLGSVDDVTVVPGSAVTPTGVGTGTVLLPGTDATSTARTVSVTTGATGQGLIQIVSGLGAGDTVILADRSAGVPANSNQRANTSRTSGTQGASSSTAVAVTPAATPSR